MISKTTALRQWSGWGLRMLMRVLKTAVFAILILGILGLAGGIWLDSQGQARDEKLRAMVVSGYYASAARGEVAVPAVEVGSVCAAGRCGLSVPFIVQVRTATGDKRTYFAQGHPGFNLRATDWTFQESGGARH